MGGKVVNVSPMSQFPPKFVSDLLWAIVSDDYSRVSESHEDIVSAALLFFIVKACVHLLKTAVMTV